jgi:hypothetical protein
MDLGLGNLDTVKRFVLPPLTLETGDTQYDAVLATLALGIAKRFETYCDRKFGRMANAVATFNANRSMYILPRYPLETVTSLTLRATAQDDWTDVTNLIVQQNEETGMLYFGTFIAESIVLMQCTFTGGYWYETKEPTDVGYPTAQPGGQFDPIANPTGSFGLLDPNYGAVALQQAWLSQLLHEFELKDRLLPTGLVGEGQKSRLNWRLDQSVLLPEVENAITQYRRYQIV